MRTLNRRDTLAGLFAAGGLGLLAGPASAAPRRLFFEQTGRSIGLQTYTLGETVGRDLDKTFAEVGAIGYREIELPSLYGHTAAEVRKSADAAGLKISSLHLAVVTRGPAAALSLQSPPEQIAEAMGTLGAKRTVLPIMLFPDGMKPQPGETPQGMISRSVIAAGPDLWKRTAAILNERAAALKPRGISLGYHNHNMEFAPLGSTTGWEILMRECDPKLVNFEVDVGWVATAGLDPVAFLAKLSGRVTQLHVKDVAAGNTKNFGLSMKPAEVGSGTLDWARILPAAAKAGVQHFYVEQEPPFAIPRIEAARRSYAYLSRLKA